MKINSAPGTDMNYSLILSLATLLVCAAQPVLAAERLLYEPRPAEASPAPPKPGDGVLVERITIKPGDTLGKLSRRYSGHGGYYPQILLFNQIANPHRIYAGDMLLVPVSRGSGTDSNDHPDKTTQSKRTDTAKTKALHKQSKHGLSGAKAQRLFEQSVSAYRRGDCRSAITGFDRFLRSYPDSPLAADATLFRADCYLKLSR
jgi:hypothetical protein